MEFQLLHRDSGGELTQHWGFMLATFSSCIGTLSETILVTGEPNSLTSWVISKPLGYRLFLSV
ncbi:hypothetical protein WJ30_13685 [Burkholderia diffusa]|nr:hypothetical protein WJ30_13685 [Burkholderia diffusa]